MSSEAKLSEQIYRWTKPDGGHDIGRKVLCHFGREVTVGLSILMRCDFGRLYWVDCREIEDHDADYRKKEKEAEGAEAQA